MAETTEKTIEIRLRSGAKIRTRDGGAGTVGLDGLHRELQQSEFVRIGGDTIVRSADVESLQIKEDGKDKRRESATRHHSPARPRRRRLVETRPFFLTSEFVLAFAAWVALLHLPRDRLRRWVDVCAPDSGDRGRLHDEPRLRESTCGERSLGSTRGGPGRQLSV